MNFAKRSKCNKCNAPRPKPGPTAGAGGDALDLSGIPVNAPAGAVFKKGDWPCPSCGNVNWAKRDTCNICNAPKPSAETMAPRLGRGGGHFDLQDPSDRKAHDSDDEEFDEFGRKKKKKKPIAPVGGGGALGGRSAFPSAATGRERERERGPFDADGGRGPNESSRGMGRGGYGGGGRYEGGGRDRERDNWRRRSRSRSRSPPDRRGGLYRQ
uniref:RanBP2-type domain-containing protein n=1 Tax=Chromera velia CCMP2878 TaxID=1169474 RepID=A0A0G4HC89_9ALVE|eukprot:Cvel_26136.t1-p1 / transcript=Cvel_26136.t1 / gene=Cvel_26136 / organism=Chromera_velia_CCMP2878 / gene_product=Zinc finger Ran-binding domain-containing protein 2, putative / transcript_product=Zinc finger Ran-binding domain-containing protein 2, putative / location=Cvel_scaffold3061:8987-12092(+) / protein_length=211 / sequence_SO=supercontig / SO=protein_coding / is_pseudo=false